MNSATETAPDEPVVLVVDDDASHRDSVVRILEREGLAVAAAPSGEAALDQLRAGAVSVLLTDLMMPGMGGHELLRVARSLAPEVEVVVMTAHGTVETAVAAMKEGAYDFVTKPLKRRSLVQTIQRALERHRLVVENRTLRAQLADLGAPGGRPLIGRSPAFRAFMETLQQVAPSEATVLLTGESGTGKELAARAIHALSPRANAPLISVHCAALPETILEAELFGVERGAFTGAVARREGRFERADGGTLFLDEVGELSPSAQVKLLRALQEGEIERLGGSATLRVDVRLLSATNKDLRQEVEAGRFREDLYYRLHVVELRIPPLSARPEDVPLLADHFLRQCAARNRKAVRAFSPEALAALEGYAWPGNVRELEHAVERAVVLSRDEVISLADLPEEVRGAPAARGRQLLIPIGTSMEEVERRVLHETLRHTGGDKTLAARLLGIAPRTIYRKLERE